MSEVARARKGSENHARLQDYAYATIKARILDESYLPGQAFSENALAQDLGISKTPVRAALHQLVRERFMDLVRGKGYFVARLSYEDVREIYEAREALESLACRLAAERIGQEQLDILERAVCAAEELRGPEPYEDMLFIDDRFHGTILSAARNQRLKETHRLLQDQIIRVKRLALRAPGRVQESCIQHRAIYEALRARSAIAAEQAMRQHLQSTKRCVLESMREPSLAQTNQGETG